MLMDVRKFSSWKKRISEGLEFRQKIGYQGVFLKILQNTYVNMLTPGDYQPMERQIIPKE